MYDFLIVGAGLTGATLAQQLTQAGASCFVVERRDHIAGNCYDTEIDGLMVNRYGGHIFHTNSSRVWEYVNHFAAWEPYEHRVKAHYRGTVYSFPPNKMTLQQLGLHGDEQHTQAVLLATFFAGYSFKQWGRPLSDIPNGIIKRIPIRDTWDDRYFTDKYQGLPVGGYTSMVERMLRDVDVSLQTDYLADRKVLNRLAKKVIYTGPLDALYDYDYGRLEYRSLHFDSQWISANDYQGCATMNYTDYQPDFTRILEWRHFGHKPATGQTLITREYPQDYDGRNEPYYPVNDNKNNDLHRQYAARADADGIIYAGRLGRYRYYDMDQAIAAGLKLAGELCT